MYKVEKPRIGRHSRRKTKREPWAEMRPVSQPLSYQEAHPAATRGSNACNTRLVFIQSHTHKRDKWAELTVKCVQGWKHNSSGCSQTWIREGFLDRGWGGFSTWPIKGESLPRGVKLKKNFSKNAKSEYLKYLNSISTDLRLFTLRKG